MFAIVRIDVMQLHEMLCHHQWLHSLLFGLITQLLLVSKKHVLQWNPDIIMSVLPVIVRFFRVGLKKVLMLDADAALIQPQLDTLRRIAAILERR